MIIMKNAYLCEEIKYLKTNQKHLPIIKLLKIFAKLFSLVLQKKSPHQVQKLQYFEYVSYSDSFESPAFTKLVIKKYNSVLKNILKKIVSDK